MKKSKISFVILMLTVKASSNVSKGNLDYHEILNGKTQD